MNERSERVVSLSDRGRGLEWLSLGFGPAVIGCGSPARSPL